jgi:SAM-dependent methyltransferase
MAVPYKRFLLAIYNPVVNRLKHYWKWGCVYLTQPWSSCSVCGRSGPKRYAPEAVPEALIQMWGLDEDGARAIRSKESLICPWCGSKYRGRRLASVLLHEMSRKSYQYKSLRELACAKESDRQPILILNWIDGLSEILKGVPNVVQTEFFDGVTSGEIHKGIRHEDAQKLTFPDATFWCVISSETLEHIPDLEKALSEIRRVLVPGGFHLFTVPLKNSVERTETRSVLDSDGQIVDQIKPRLHHPGGTWGWPVFTEFGNDFVEVLRKKGFMVCVDRQELSELTVSQMSSICPVFVVSEQSKSS